MYWKLYSQSDGEIALPSIISLLSFVNEWNNFNAISLATVLCASVCPPVCGVVVTASIGGPIPYRGKIWQAIYLAKCSILAFGEFYIWQVAP